MTRTLSALCLSALLGCTRGRDTPPVDRSDGVVPELRVPWVPAGAVRVDGALDEGEWARVGHIEGFVAPGTGRSVRGSRANAEAWIAWCDEGLLVAFRVLDGAPRSFVPAGARDPHIWERSTGVELMLQPGDRGDNRDYFELQYGPDGARWSTRFDDYNRPITRGPDGATRYGHEDWEPDDQHRFASIPRRGAYAVEALIRWSSFDRPRPSAGDVWRANLYAFRDGQREATAWSPTLGQGNFHRASRFGRLRFAR